MKFSILIFVLFLTAFGSQAHAQTKEQHIAFADGLDKYQSQAIAGALSEVITDNLKFYLTESHFVFGCRDAPDNPDCRQNLNFQVKFKATTVDLNNDGTGEVIAQYIQSDMCGSGGCTAYVLQKIDDSWKVIGTIFPASDDMRVSTKPTNSFLDIHYAGKSANYKCVYKKFQYDCE